MRNRAGGILIENGMILLIHRIKKINGIEKEYYVIPGGGVEEGETLEVATKRELKEEVGIDIEILSNEPLFILQEDTGTQYFSLIKRIGGEIGTGEGSEFTDESYADKGFFGVEMINIKDIINKKIKLVPDEIKKNFIDLVNKYEIENLNSYDLI